VCGRAKSCTPSVHSRSSHREWHTMFTPSIHTPRCAQEGDVDLASWLQATKHSHHVMFMFIRPAGGRPPDFVPDKRPHGLATSLGNSNQVSVATSPAKAKSAPVPRTHAAARTGRRRRGRRSRTSREESNHEKGGVEPQEKRNRTTRREESNHKKGGVEPRADH
jgi:hypothetical protein